MSYIMDGCLPEPIATTMPVCLWIVSAMALFTHRGRFSILVTRFFSFEAPRLSS